MVNKAFWLTVLHEVTAQLAVLVLVIPVLLFKLHADICLPRSKVLLIHNTNQTFINQLDNVT